MPDPLIRVVAEIASTNSALLAQLAEGAVPAEGHWLVADRQTAGRGRAGRVWSGGFGNFTGSTAVALRDGASLPQTLALVAGVSVHRALMAVVPELPDLRLKWPNDLLVGEAKLGGILLERQRDAVVVGIGINLAHHPDDTPYPAIDLASSGVHLDVEMVLKALCDAFDRLLSVWDRGQGFARIRQLWLDHAAYLDKAIEIRTERGVLHGRFAGLDAEGRLLLQPDTQGQEQGLKTIEAGDFYPLDLVEQLRPQKG